MSTNLQTGTPQFTVPVVNFTAQECADIMAEAKAEARELYKKDLLKKMMAQGPKKVDRI